MNPDQWSEVEKLYHAALEHEPSERGVFLGQCPDEEVRREVQSLLDHEQEGDELLENPRWRPNLSGPSLAAGTRLGPYEILELIGAGGMGEVYRARDTKLGRNIALKVLPEERLADAQSQQRLIREARAASALNHPNIVTVHEIGSENGVDFIAMEFVEGKSLKELIPAKGLPLGKALDYAVQIASGLAKAHAAGIIHRDLKPGNIMVTSDGVVKLMDFGLARRLRRAESDTASLTHEGENAGTPAYMSPEQAEAKSLDARSDIFSFGVVLYEMLTGRQAFAGDSAASVMAAVLREEPPPIGEKVPRDVEKVVVRCLQKDPARRFQHTEDLKVELEELAAAQALALPHKRRLLQLVLAVGAVIALVEAGALVWQRIHAAPLTDKDMLVLGDFTNTTGDTVFDDTLKEGLAVQLEQSPFLSLVSERRVNETLKLMGRPVGDRLTSEVAREVCQRTSSKAMLTGSIGALGSQYVLGVKAIDCDTGDVLAEAQEQAAAKEAVLKALDDAALKLRRKLGESLASVQRYATPVEKATTPSWDALKAYSLGVKTSTTKSDSPLPFFQRAIDLDPGFAMAYNSIGDFYFFSNEGKRGAEYVRKAHVLRDKVSEPERFTIDASYYTLVTGELEKAVQTVELWEQTYPRDVYARLHVIFVSSLLGNWEKCLEQSQVALRLDPGIATNYSNLGITYAVFNRLNDAEVVYKESEKRKLETGWLLQSRYLLAFLKGDAAQMARLVSAAMGKPGSEHLLLATQADTEGWYGRLRNARELTGRAMDSAQRNDAKEAAAAYQAAAALREAEAVNREWALAAARAAVKLAPNRDVRAMAALARARAGDAAGAEELAAELEKEFPLDTLVQRYWLPTIRAGIALERKDPNRAIELLKAAATIELSGAQVTLCPVYVRGAAYLMLRDGNRAAAEFQKFIDHRGLALNFLWGALARLGLARAYALQGNTAKAGAAYQDFLGIWKDADPDVPILRQAKAEYARLQ